MATITTVLFADDLTTSVTCSALLAAASMCAVFAMSYCMHYCWLCCEQQYPVLQSSCLFHCIHCASVQPTHSQEQDPITTHSIACTKAASVTVAEACLVT